MKKQTAAIPTRATKVNASIFPVVTSNAIVTTDSPETCAILKLMHVQTTRACMENAINDLLVTVNQTLILKMSQTKLKMSLMSLKRQKKRPKMSLTSQLPARGILTLTNHTIPASLANHQNQVMEDLTLTNHTNLESRRNQVMEDLILTNHTSPESHRNQGMEDRILMNLRSRASLAKVLIPMSQRRTANLRNLKNPNDRSISCQDMVTTNVVAHLATLAETVRLKSMNVQAIRAYMEHAMIKSIATSAHVFQATPELTVNQRLTDVILTHVKKETVSIFPEVTSNATAIMDTQENCVIR
jgi:hypothetical protein